MNKTKSPKPKPTPYCTAPASMPQPPVPKQPKPAPKPATKPQPRPTRLGMDDPFVEEATLETKIKAEKFVNKAIGIRNSAGGVNDRRKL